MFITLYLETGLVQRKLLSKDLNLHIMCVYNETKQNGMLGIKRQLIFIIFIANINLI